MNRYAELTGPDSHGVRAIANTINAEEKPGPEHGEWVLCGDAGPGFTTTDGGLTFLAPVPVSLVPTVLTMRQARLVLFTAGLINSVQAAINALPSPQKEKAQIEWDFSNEVQRHNGFVSQLAPALGLTSEQVDALFVTGAAL